MGHFKNLLLIALLVLITKSPVYADTYNVFYPQELKNPNLVYITTPTGWTVSVTGTMNGYPVSYASGNPQKIVKFPLTLIGVPVSKASHVWLKKVD